MFFVILWTITSSLIFSEALANPPFVPFVSKTGCSAIATIPSGSKVLLPPEGPFQKKMKEVARCYASAGEILDQYYRFKGSLPESERAMIFDWLDGRTTTLR